MNIKEFREKLNLTRAQLARKLDVRESEIEAWEAGTLKPTDTMITELAKIFSCSAEELKESLSLPIVKKPINPIKCPSCKSKNLAIITEWHKCWGLRILELVLVTITVILALFTFFEIIVEPYPQLQTIPVIIGFSIGIVIVHIFIILFESRTHIQCVCRDCGYDWLHNE